MTYVDSVIMMGGDVGGDSCSTTSIPSDSMSPTVMESSCSCNI